MDNVHLSINKHKCNVCRKRVATRSALDAHIGTQHLNAEKKHSCPVCPHRSKSQDHMAVHIRMRHLSMREHVCHICDKRLPTMGNLDVHIARLHGHSERIPVVSLPSAIRGLSATI